MKGNKPMKTITNITYPAFALFAFACFALSPQVRAVDPPPDGGYPNENTAEGEDALFSLTTGTDNTAVVYHALHDNTTGGSNTTIGAEALSDNTTGAFNTAIGFNAMLSNTAGDENTATGLGALLSNTVGNSNTAYGSAALTLCRIGNNNTAVGDGALQLSSSGNENIALGYLAGFQITAGSHNIDIGHMGQTNDSGIIRIGTKPTHKNTFIAGISGATVPTGVAVIVDSTGHLGTTTSSARFKDEIKPMGKASEAILALQPVRFRYKKDLDPAHIAQFGLVAEDVEKVNPDLVARDDQGKPYTVRYEAVNAMLLNEFLKARRQIDAQQKQIDALTAGLQKVSAQVEASKPKP
jgi:hypothetical protein